MTSNTGLSAINQQLKQLFIARELEPQYDAAVEYLDKAIDEITRVRRPVNELKGAEASAPMTSSATDTSDQKAARQLTRASFSSASGSRLPWLELPIFKGDLSHWLTFSEQY